MFCSHNTCAQQDMPQPIDTTDLSGLSLEQLKHLKSQYAATDMEKNINLAIEAASNNPLSLRKSPSIISVITGEEITRTGAKTLLDVLKTIPGMEVNVDVQGVVALSFRGLWANEGNLMLMIDGFEFNENAYNSLQLGNHYPVSDIKRIEVIRGPGSAIYGGTAEFAVINIMTQRGEDIKGGKLGVVAGQAQNGFTQQNVNWAIGNKVNNFGYSLTGVFGRAQTSQSDYKDVYGTSFNMTDNAPSQTLYLNGNVSFKNWAFKIIYDDYQCYTRDGYQAALSKPYPNYFKNVMGDVRYRKAIGKKWNIQSRLSYKQCIPWQNKLEIAPVDTGNFNVYSLRAERYKFNISANWEHSKRFSANFGVDANYDIGTKTDGELFKNNNATQFSFFNYAPFAQLLFNHRIANVTLGARYDVSSAYGSAFNPRLGITKRVGVANFKLLFASSFRAPSIENIDYSLNKVELKPERSNTIEFEASFKISKYMFLSANLFDITTENAIKYFVRSDSLTVGDPDGYRNSNVRCGSRGFELEYKYTTPKGMLRINYSYNSTAGKQIDSLNMVPGHSESTLGIAPYKFSVLASKTVLKKFYVAPSFQFIGERFAITALTSTGSPIYSTIPAQSVFNLHIGTDAMIRNVSLGLGVKNLTDEKILYPQAYNSLHAPLPGMGRELYLMVNYSFRKKEQNK